MRCQSGAPLVMRFNCREEPWPRCGLALLPASASPWPRCGLALLPTLASYLGFPPWLSALASRLGFPPWLAALAGLLGPSSLGIPRSAAQVSLVASDVLPSGGPLAAQLGPSGCATTVWLPPAFWLPSGGLARRWPALWQCFLAARSAGAGGTLALSFGCFLAAFWWLARPGPARPSTLAALRVAFWLLRPAQPASAGLSPDSLAAFWRHRSWRLPSCCPTLW